MKTRLIRATYPHGGGNPGKRAQNARSLNQDGGANQAGNYLYVWDDPPKTPVAYGFPTNNFQFSFKVKMIL